jgi:hypothetical protein
MLAALAVSHWIETMTGWSIKKFVRTARHYRNHHHRPRPRRPPGSPDQC